MNGNLRIKFEIIWCILCASKKLLKKHFSWNVRKTFIQISVSILCFSHLISSSRFVRRILRGDKDTEPIIEYVKVPRGDHPVVPVQTCVSDRQYTGCVPI